MSWICTVSYSTGTDPRQRVSPTTSFAATSEWSSIELVGVILEGQERQNDPNRGPFDKQRMYVTDGWGVTLCDVIESRYISGRYEPVRNKLSSKMTDDSTGVMV
jgi:hypothetical protein